MNIEKYGYVPSASEEKERDAVLDDIETRDFTLPIGEIALRESGSIAKTKESALEEIRLKHIDFLNGVYDPSPEEFDLFDVDDDFYESSEYLLYRKRELERFSKRRPDIYTPSDGRIFHAILPFAELIQDDMDNLQRISRVDIDGITRANVVRLTDYFAEKFKVEDTPNLTIEEESVDGSLGHYDRANNIINIDINRHQTMAEMIDTIVHELWHSHQYQSSSNNELYRVNFENYFESSIDYDSYRTQLIEREAFGIGTFVGDAYRTADLKLNQGKFINMVLKYDQWRRGKYDPNESRDGVDERYLIIANKMFRQLKKSYNERHKRRA